MSSSNFIFRREPRALLWAKTWGSKKTESSPHINLDAFLLLVTAASSVWQWARCHTQEQVWVFPASMQNYQGWDPHANVLPHNLISFNWHSNNIGTTHYVWLQLSFFMQDLPRLKCLDLSHNEIASVSDLHTKIGNLSKLILAFNQVVTLEGKYTYQYSYWHTCIRMCIVLWCYLVLCSGSLFGTLHSL